MTYTAKSMVSKATLTCMSLDCDERKSRCCGAISKRALGKYTNNFVCSKCEKPFVGGACTAGDQIVSSPKMECPKCHAEYDDYDGFGVLYCDKCGYCKHVSLTGDVCDCCKKKPYAPPAKRERWEKEFDKNVNFDEAELGCNWGMEEVKDFIRSLLEKISTPPTKEEWIERFKYRYLPIEKRDALNLNGESITVNVLDLIDFIRTELARERKRMVGEI